MINALKELHLISPAMPRVSPDTSLLLLPKVA